MHIRVLAVGTRQPDWVNSAFDDYAGRLPPQWKFRLDEIPAVHRGRRSGDPRDAESEKLLGALRDGERLIVLDERGRQVSSVELGDWLADWQRDGRDIALAIGGADGLAPACLERAEQRWSLSKLTLPHGLARVVLAEQLYRAWSIGAGHPYHRA